MSRKKKPENKPTRIEAGDFWRLVDKSTKANMREIVISEASAVTARSITSEYHRQCIEDQSNAGSAPKRKEGIWEATIGLVKRKPDITAPEAWNEFSESPWESTDSKFEVYRDGDRLVQIDHRPGKRREVAIKYETFRREYLAKAKKEIKSSGD